MRHVCTNFTIEVVDERHAEGICYLTVYRHEPLSEAAGRSAAVPAVPPVGSSTTGSSMRTEPG